MNKLKLMRITKRYKLREIAEGTGLRSNTLSMYENGHRKISIEKLKKLSKFYDCKIEELID